MKLASKLISVGLFVVVVSTGRVALASGPVNLLSNGGFESGLTGWAPAPQHSLVTDKAAAHTGKACLTGKVTQPKQALKLRRRVRAKAGNRYEFEIWARATNRTKLVLWAQLPGVEKRQMIAAWTNVPRKWKRFQCPMTVKTDGELALDIIAPSSHGAPAGQIWVDDIALFETEMPPVTSVSGGVGFSDEPAMARAADGSVYVAWTSFRDGADSLQIARCQPAGKTFKALGTWQVLGGKGTYCLGPRAVSAGQNVFVVYAAEKDKNWDVYVVPCGPGGPGRPVVVTAHKGVDVKPAAAWHEGVLWLAWESNRNGCRQVFAGSVRGDDVSEPVAVSATGGSCYDPSVVVLASGEVCVAWHGFRQHN